MRPPKEGPFQRMIIEEAFLINSLRSLAKLVQLPLEIYSLEIKNKLQEDSGHQPLNRVSLQRRFF